MRKFIKIFSVSVVGVVLLAAGFVAFCFARFSQFSEEKFPLHPELTAALQVNAKPDIELGRRIYMVRNGCVDCHGPDLSGAPIMENGAMGSIHGANITPYKTREMKDEDLARAIRYGVHSTGRSLRFMPSFDYEGLSREDLVSLIAFVRSVPEVKRPDHANTFGPVAKVMSSLGKMPVVFPARVIDHASGFQEKPAEGPTAAFGKYLANSCTGCHGREYRGGPIPGGDPSWPEAVSIRMGKGTGWTRESFVNTIKTGVSTKTGQKIRTPMPVVALQQMNETEIEALWSFLSTLE